MDQERGEGPCSLKNTSSRLADLYRAQRTEIIFSWKRQVSQLESAKGLEHPALIDHIPDLLDEIIADLALHRDGPIAEEHAKGSPPMHGVQRVEDGFDIAEVVAEYHLLRDTLLECAVRHQFVLDEEVRRLLHRRIDEATALSVRAFAGHHAAELKRRRDEHLAFITHDLRTPLNAISLTLQILQLDWPGEMKRETAEDFQTIQRNVARIDRLVLRALEDVAAAKPGSVFVPELRRFDLWPLIQRLVMDLGAIATQERVAVSNNVPRNLEVWADAGLLSQVFQNLLSNSFRFAPGGMVTISAQTNEPQERIECEVRDDGDGIDAARLERIFDIHETDPDPAKKSTGLGLAIVKQIVEAHGGEISATSGPGKGATFRFWLPCGPRD